MPWFLTGFSTLASTLSETFVETKLWSWSDAESSCEAPRWTPWTRYHELGRQTMQVISNGGLLCSKNKGSCRRSFDALVRRRSHSAMSSWPSLSNALSGSRFSGWLAPVPMRLTHRTVQVISNGDLLCFSNKGSCRRSFDASSQSAAFDEYSTGLLILAPTLSEMFVQTMLWPWSNAKSSYEAPSQTPWIHCRKMGRQTMQVISNGGLLCSGNKGSCRRSFDALVRRRSHSAMSSWPSLSNALSGSRFTGWPAPVPMRLTHRTVQVISNGDLLCFSNKGSCRRSFDASSQSAAFDEYSTGLLILAPTLSEMFVQTMLWPWSNAKSSYEAPSQTPWIHCRKMGRQTMQVISNGGLLCFIARGCADGALMQVRNMCGFR